MLHLTAGIFGSQELAKKLGKAGTINDIAIYNHGSSEGVFTYVAVNSDKIQPLLQVINMIQVPVLAISEITPTLGEQIVAIAEFGFGHGFILLDGISQEQIMPLIKGTCIEKFVFVSSPTDLVEGLKKIKTEQPAGEVLIPIDNYFDVKSVGTVILGIVRRGSVRKHDKLIVQPLEKEVLVKGIQSQDKDLESAEFGTRVGLNLKGIETDELKRGYVLGNMMKSKSFKLKFFRSKYSKEQLKENDPVFLSSGLQVATARVKSAGELLELEAENFLLYEKDTKFLVATTKQAMPRIIGRGFIL